MAEETIFCPSCNHKLRVPEELLGTTVQCPMCNITFTAPPRGSADRPPGGRAEEAYQAPPRATPETEGPPGAPPEGAYSPRPSRRRDADEEEYPAEYGRQRPRDWEYGQDRRSRVRHLVYPPAIALIVTGILGTLINLAQVLMYVLIPGEVQKMQANNPLLSGSEPAPPALSMIVGGVFVVVSILVVVGGFQMMRFSGYTMAIAGSILAMLDCGNLCCILGLPVGIWAVIVLMLPNVREAFE